MKLGTFLMPVHPPEKSRTACFDEDIEFVVYADELGFTEAWCGHHVTLEWEPIPANDVFMANLIARTKNIKLGIGVSILPQHHPANVAARVALLDHLAHGRVYWGLWPGRSANGLGIVQSSRRQDAGANDRRGTRNYSHAVDPGSSVQV